LSGQDRGGAVIGSCSAPTICLPIKLLRPLLK
jgi:hypothetical protein